MTVRKEKSSRHGRDRREAIIDAAIATLANAGYARLSLRNVAARAGMRVGNLQYYYRSKTALVRALLDRTIARAVAVVEDGGRHAAPEGLAVDDASAGRRPADAATAPVPVTAPVHAVVDGLLAAQTSAARDGVFRELWALAAHDPGVDAAMRDLYARYWRTLVALLLATNPRLGRPRAERRAALIVALVEGLALFRERRPPHGLPLPALEKEIDALVEHLAGAD